MNSPPKRWGAYRGRRVHRGVPGTVVPISEDVEGAVRVGRAAIGRSPWAGARAEEFQDRFEQGARAGGRTGAVYRPAGRTVGVAVWEAHAALGASVNLLAIEPESASPAAYREFWDGLREIAGPVAFAPGNLDGLPREAEERLMGAIGLRPFARSEMRWRAGPLPAPELPEGTRVRPVSRTDRSELVRLHRLAYRDRFDRYLFLEEEDEERDAERLVGDLFDGRWGEVVAEGSRGLERDGRLLGVVLSVGRPDGVLIADVAVDPAVQGRGIGRTVLASALRALASAGRLPVLLNVTEGNDPALRLYARLGFERTLGPSPGWYDPARIPAAP